MKFKVTREEIEKKAAYFYECNIYALKDLDEFILEGEEVKEKWSECNACFDGFHTECVDKSCECPHSPKQKEIYVEAKGGDAKIEIKKELLYSKQKEEEWQCGYCGFKTKVHLEGVKHIRSCWPSHKQKQDIDLPEEMPDGEYSIREALFAEKIDKIIRYLRSHNKR